MVTEDAQGVQKGRTSSFFLNWSCGWELKTFRESFLEKVKFELRFEGKGGISCAGKGRGAKCLLFLLDRTDCKKAIR